MRQLIFIFFLLFASVLFSDTLLVEKKNDKNPITKLTQIEKNWIKENQLISFTGDPNWLPYEAFKEDGTYIGIVADYLELIENSTGLKFKPQVTSSWSESLDLATQGKVQVISGDAADAILNKNFYPVDAYSHNPIVMVMNIEQNYVENLNEIATKKIAIIKDYGYTADIYKVYPHINFIEVNNIQEGLEGVAQGRFDTLLATMALASYTITKMQLHNIKVVGKTPIVMDLTLFVSKDEPVLHSILNKTFHSITDKEKLVISQKWLSQDYIEKIDTIFLLQIFSLFFLFLFIALFWNYKMGKEIQRRKDIQVSLEKSEKYLQDIFDNAQSGLMYITGDRILIKGNQRLADIFAYKNPEEMIGISMRKLHLSEENYINYGKSNFETLRMGVKRYIEYELRRKDGSSVWCEISGKAIDNNIPADMSKGILWTINDISIRKEYEFSLKKSEERYRTLFHGNKAVELIIDPQSFKIIDCNKSAETFYGYSRDELLAMKITDINILHDSEIAEEIKLAQDEKRQFFHFKHKLSNATIKDVEVYSGPIEIENKVYLYSIIFDITEKIELEKNQNLLQERLSYAMEGSNDGLWDWNVQTGELFISPRWKEIIGYADYELNNHISTWEELIHPDDAKDSWAEFERFQNSNNPNDRFNINFQMRHKKGYYVPIMSRARKVLNNEGKLLRLVGTHVDMSELYSVQNAYKKERDRSQLYLDTARVLLVALDYEGRVTMLNKKGEELLGYREEELLGKVWFEIGVLPNDIATNVKAFFDDLLTFKKLPSEEAQHYLIAKDGKNILFDFYSSLLFDDENNCIGIISSGLDITQKVLAQEEINKQHTFLQTVMNSVTDSIMVIEKDYTVSLMNNAARENMDENWISNSSKPKCYEVFHQKKTPCNGNEYPCPLEQVVQSKSISRVVHAYQDYNQNDIFVELTAVPLFNENNEVEAIIESAHDITELKSIQNSLQHQAEHDALTNLPNRVLFIDRVKQLIKHAHRSKEKVAVLFMDLDHFKEINDSLGHKVGDILLQQVSNRLLENIRESDTVARLGGDEFTIVIDQVKSLDTITSVIQKIMRSFSQPFIIEAHTLYMTMSIGVSLFPDDGKDADMLLKNADAAMYKAKHSGRNNYQYYTQDMTEHAFERIILETQLRESLEKNEMEVYYQLQVDARNDKLIGMEALIRWNHPNLGRVSPDKFIPLAEDTGFIIAIDEWVMSEALTTFKEWYDKGYNPGILSLNLSPLRLEQENFIAKLEDAIERAGVKSSWLALEVTEGQIMRNPEKAIETLNEIHNLGIRLAIDDFGTGYSSLAYLKSLPIDKLKIDQSFVRDIPDDNDDVEITKTIISMAKGLNLNVIAEGVETQEQKEFLVANGCNEIQGYFYHKPSSANDVEKELIEKIK